jgi:hypothetical protein
VPPGASGGKSARRPPACPDMVASPTIKLVLFSSSPPAGYRGQRECAADPALRAAGSPGLAGARVAWAPPAPRPQAGPG